MKKSEQSGKPSQKSKDAILKGLYEDNLWVAGRSPERRRVPRQAPARHGHRNIVVVAALLMGIIGGSITVVAWREPMDQLELTTKVNQEALRLLEDSGVLVDIPQPEEQDLEASDAEMAAAAVHDEKVMAALEQKYGVARSLSPRVVVEGNTRELRQESDEAKRLSALTQSKIPLAELFGLDVSTIVIDPGHGGRDPGAIGRLGGYEKHIALEVGQRLKERLLAYNNLTVLMTRESDQAISLNDRVAFANEQNADLFVSIHVNYLPKEHDNFVETYFFGPTDDEKVVNLAVRENASSKFPYAKFKDILLKIGDTLKFQESRKLAQSIQHNLHRHMAKIEPKTIDHGIKSAPFVVLLGLDAPSILTEISCFCNNAEEKRLGKSDYREKIAMFLEQGIVQYLNNKSKVGGKRNGEEKKLAQTQ